MSFQKARTQAGRFYRQIRTIWSEQGAHGITNRLRASAAERLASKSVVLPVELDQVLKADLSQPAKWNVPRVIHGEPVTINWVMVPPGPKSGGHTTIFRIINYLQSQGYENRIYFYNLSYADHAYYASVVRDFYGFNGEVAPLKNGMNDAHAVVATAWPTAYPVYNSSCAGKRFYFVQDYEPYFHPVGALGLFAENTYRMGFHGITAGKWLADKLTTEFGMAADYFQFGCDTTTYHRNADSIRKGVVFYGRPDAPRRGFELGIITMQLFAERHPEIDIHFYGDRIGPLPFRFIDHGRIMPSELNRIYNSCFAGLSISLTNVSLVPHEMLAAGCIPIVNDAHHNRIVLDNSYVRYAQAYPQALVGELEAIIADPNFDLLSRSAAESVHLSSWEDAGKKVDTIFRAAIEAPALIQQ